ncbi:hypothetical protein N8U98_001089 [Campylobacter jejuni]|nr:hypothetical protein [Campylobacter jejuni]EJR1830481.1 hypothetical protein [Campylobacter jejuni]EJS9953033.1 hypothetical protein [Campylobacter jejuni]EJW1367185.1 hypothetical protein [Campylobacter jejuni]EJW8184715.1 hypothetical protein [Campylobacter jejuni]
MFPNGNFIFPPTYSYPILTKDTKCSFCENFFSIEYSSNLKTIEKECPFYNNKMDIKLKD